jgi:hypothetical protein
MVAMFEQGQPSEQCEQITFKINAWLIQQRARRKGIKERNYYSSCNFLISSALGTEVGFRPHTHHHMPPSSSKQLLRKIYGDIQPLASFLTDELNIRIETPQDVPDDPLHSFLATSLIARNPSLTSSHTGLPIQNEPSSSQSDVSFQVEWVFTN